MLFFHWDTAVNKKRHNSFPYEHYGTYGTIDIRWFKSYNLNKLSADIEDASRLHYKFPFQHMGSRGLLGGSEISVIYEMHISWGE